MRRAGHVTSEGKCGETRSVESTHLHFSMATFLQVTSLNDLDKFVLVHNPATAQTHQVPVKPQHYHHPPSRRRATFNTRHCHTPTLHRYHETTVQRYYITTAPDYLATESDVTVKIYLPYYISYVLSYDVTQMLSFSNYIKSQKNKSVL